MIEARLKEFAGKHFRIRLAAALLFAIALALVTFFICLLLLKPFYWIVPGLIVPWLFLRRLSRLDAARHIERREPKFADRLVNAYQLSVLPRTSPENYSPDLIRAAVDEVEDELEKAELGTYLELGGLGRGLQLIALAAILVLGYAALAPGRFSYGLTRNISLHLEPPNRRIVRGQEIILGVRAFGIHLPGQAGLEIDWGKARSFFKLPLVDGRAGKTIRIEQDFSYRFVVFDKSTPSCMIRLEEPLAIRELSVEYVYPAYTGLAPQVTMKGEVAALRGTKVLLQGRASARLESGFLVIDCDTLPLSLSGEKFSREFVLKSTGLGWLLLTRMCLPKGHRGVGERGNDSLVARLPIVSIPDLAPLIEVGSPEPEIDLPIDMNVMLGVRVVDDYGLSRVDLIYRLKDKESSRPIEIRKGQAEETLSLDWDLAGLGMLPGDELTYYVQGWDNDAYSGPKASRSELMRIRFPTVAEIYEDVAGKEDRLAEDLGRLEEQQGALSENLQRIEEKYRRAKKIDWSDRKDLEGIVNRQQELAAKAEAWIRELERAVDKMNEGMVLDKEAVDRLEEMSRLMQEIMPDEYASLVKRLEERLVRDGPEFGADLKRLKAAQADIRKNIERALEVLKRFRHEEKLKALVLKAEKLLQEQRSIELLKDRPTQAEAQRKVGEGLNQMKKDIGDLIDDASLEKGTREELKDLLKDIEARRVVEKTAQAEKALRENDKSAAGQISQAVAKDIEDIKEMLSSLQNRLAKQRKDDVQRDIGRRISSLLAISEEQEAIAQGRTADPGPHQRALLESMRELGDSLFGTQKKSMFVGSDVGKGMGRSMDLMAGAVGSFEGANAELGRGQATEALAQMNETAQKLINSLQDAAQGGSSTGMDGFMAALSSLSFEQMMLNQSLEGLMPIPVGGMGSALREQLGRLAARQRELRQELAGLGQELSDSNLRDALDALAKTMEESEKELYQYRLDRQLIERQQTILSRLLDTQKSIRKQDTEKKRIAKSGEDKIDRARPRQLSEDLGERKRRLREELMKGLKEGYPPEYERLIRAYFEELMKE